MSRWGSIEQRLASKIVEKTGCWIFVGTLSPKGYGKIYYAGFELGEAI